MSSTNFMSCSITSTERFLMMRLSSSAVLTRSLTLMPATGSSSISRSGSWISSMPISSHCFWPWLRNSRVGVELVLQEDHLGDFLDAVAHRGVALEGQRAEHGAAARKRNLEILEHGEVVIDRRRLELAADAGLHDLVLLQLGQLLAAELDRAGRRLGLAADQIEHRGLAGAVGADDDADLVFLDIEREIVDRLEAVERDGERLRPRAGNPWAGDRSA